ncbi:MAG: sulfite exporter TauE/SafE family protein [Phycisphaerae bacterium]|nr:sulfite exporter TauE/SafE family protein [Phycisphaerae bacterium]
MNSDELLTLLPIGLLAGFCGGLLGIGGSVVIIPALIIFFGGRQQHLYQAAAMIVNFFVVVPSVIRHFQARATLRPITRWMIPGALIGVVAGVYLSELPVFRGAGQGYLQIAFAIFLAYVLIYNLRRLTSAIRMPRISESQAAERSGFVAFAGVGVPTGVTGGLLGIGGGLFAVPAQQLLLRIPLRNAIANSASAILWTSVVGAAFKSAKLSGHGHDWTDAIWMAIVMAPPAMIGSWYSAAKVHVWPVRVTRLAFSLLLIYAIIRLATTGWAQIYGGS